MGGFKLCKNLLLLLALILVSLLVIMTSAEQNRRADGSYVEKAGKGPKTVRKMWPEMVGLPAERAEKIISPEMPTLMIVVLPYNAHVTTEFNGNRVRILVDEHRIVVRVPMISCQVSISQCPPKHVAAQLPNLQ